MSVKTELFELRLKILTDENHIPKYHIKNQLKKKLSSNMRRHLKKMLDVSDKTLLLKQITDISRNCECDTCIRERNETGRDIFQRQDERRDDETYDGRDEYDRRTGTIDHISGTVSGIPMEQVMRDPLDHNNPVSTIPYTAIEGIEAFAPFHFSDAVRAMWGSGIQELMLLSEDQEAESLRHFMNNVEIERLARIGTVPLDLQEAYL